jgi:alkaline phosphatase D
MLEVYELLSPAMKRREFLRNTGWFVVGASVLGSAACGDDDDYPGPGPEPEPQPAGTYSFPQGVASGDPRDTTVVLWTRVALSRAPDAQFGAVRVQVQVSPDASFARLVVDQFILASGASDHTVRVLVTGLSANTTYHYRFVADNDKIAGRTRTAPAADADVQVNLAWISCQDYGAGNYGAYRQMIIDDDARAEGDKLHAVVHLGDMIYETRADGFQGAINDNFEPIMLNNRDGKPRAVGPFPSSAEATFATTVDDYRHLYRTFLSDPDLMAARARWPFICVWDDHEFTDDSWQSQANYKEGLTLDEPSQRRKVAANQAWFEYTPAHLTGAPGVKDVPSQSKDFAFVTVEDSPFTAPNDDNLVDEPNNVAAIDSLVIFRSLRFGKHVELVMTDQRSFRSDHAIPEELTNNQLFFARRNALPLPVVNIFDQGKTANGGAPPATVLGLPNVRAQSPVGTILGTDQKAWWKATMKGSNATWKLWGNEVPLMRMRVVNDANNSLGVDRVVTGDAWDGYPTERNELMTYLRTEGISNVVVLTGDVHAAFAGTISDDFDAAVQEVVACELIAPGASSNSLFSFFESATRPAALAGLRGIITVDKNGTRFTENLNMLLMHGTNAAGAYATVPQVTEEAAFGLRVDANPHMLYADTNAQGYGYLKVNGAEVKSTIITINRPIAAPSDAGPGIKRAASFTIPKDNPEGMTFSAFTGARQFGLRNPPVSTGERE